MFDRIVTDPKIHGGAACVRGTRLTVSTIQGLLESGSSVERVLELYPYIDSEDVAQCQCFKTPISD